jgi:hypothetical protein
MGMIEVTNAQMSIHELPRNIVINNFYARLSGYYKDYLDACFEGSFTRKEVDANVYARVYSCR